MENKDIINFKRITNITEIPSAIQDFSGTNHYLAIGRQDGTIEIWCNKSWICLIKINGFENLDLRRIFLFYNEKGDQKRDISKYSLISCSLSGYVIEWDIINRNIKHSFQNHGGEIWDACLTNTKEEIVISCNDGVIRKLNIVKGIYLVKQFSKIISPCISIDYIYSNNCEIIISGHKNGMINKWVNGILKQSLGKSTFIKNNKTIKETDIENESENNICEEYIWKIKIINSDYFVTGNSNGFLQIWDLNFGIIKYQFKEHMSSILTIEYSYENSMIYYSGCDSIICCIKHIKDEFKLTSKLRPQSHDINKLLLLDKNTLLSGGITTDICIINLLNGRFYEKFNKKNYQIKRHISSFNQKSSIKMIQLNNKSILILQQFLRKIHLYEIKEKTEEIKLILELNSKENSNIVSSNINCKGDFICYSNSDKTILFKYNQQKNTIKRYKTYNISSFDLYFGMENYLILINNEGLYIDKNIESLQIESINIDFKQKGNRLEDDNFYITYNYLSNKEKHSPIIFTSYDTIHKNLCIVRLNDIDNNDNSKSNQVEIINTKLINSIQVPYLKYQITKSCFLNQNEIILFDQMNNIFIYNFHTFTFNKSISGKSPENLSRWYNKIFGVIKITDELIIAYTDYNYIPIYLNKEIPKQSDIERDIISRNKAKSIECNTKSFHDFIINKSSTILPDRNQGNNNFKIYTKFISNIFMQSFNDNTIYVIEVDWNNILTQIVDPIVKHRFGK